MRPWWFVALAGCVGPEPVSYEPTAPTVVIAVVSSESESMFDDGNVIYLDDERNVLRVDAPAGFESWMFELDAPLADLDLDRGTFPTERRCAGCGCRWLPEPSTAVGPGGAVDDAPEWFTGAKIAPLAPSVCRGRTVAADADGAPQRCSDDAVDSPSPPAEITARDPPCLGTQCGEEAFALAECQAPEVPLLGVGCVGYFSACPARWPDEVAADAVFVDAAAPPGGDGTQQTPFATLTEALAAGTATIALAAGDYATATVDREVTIVGACAAQTSFDRIEFSGGWTSSLRAVTVSRLDVTRGARVALGRVIVERSLTVEDCAAISAIESFFDTWVSATNSADIALTDVNLGGGAACEDQPDDVVPTEAAGERAGWTDDCRDEGRLTMARTISDSQNVPAIGGVGCRVDVTESLLTSASRGVLLEDSTAVLDHSIIRTTGREAAVRSDADREREDVQLTLTHVIIDAAVFGMRIEGAPVHLVDTLVGNRCDPHSESIRVRGNGTRLERVEAVGRIELKDSTQAYPNVVAGSDLLVVDCPLHESEVLRIERSTVDFDRLEIRTVGSDGLSLQDGTAGRIDDVRINGGRKGIISVLREAPFDLERVSVTDTATAIEMSEGILRISDAFIDGSGGRNAITELVGESDRNLELRRFVVTGYENFMVRDEAAVPTTARFAFTNGRIDVPIDDSYFVLDADGCDHPYVVLDRVALAESEGR